VKRSSTSSWANGPVRVRWSSNLLLLQQRGLVLLMSLTSITWLLAAVVEVVQVQIHQMEGVEEVRLVGIVLVQD